MTEQRKIAIPASLLPSDGRFGSGPSRIVSSFVDDLASSSTTYLGTSHRRPRVRNVIASIREGLTSLYDLPNGYEVILGVGGATAFYDAAAFGLIENRSAHFVCGEFSERFASVVAGAPHLDDPVVIAAEYGSAPVPEEVAGVDAAAYIHNETSTGVIAPFQRIGEALVVVDGTSAVGAIPFDVRSVDAYYFSPQKALGSEGGLWLALVSPAAIERIESINASDRWIPRFLSLSVALSNSRKDQTYNTPALTTLYLLDRQLGLTLAGGGLETAFRTSDASAQHLYTWAEANAHTSPFVEDKRFRSPTVVTIDIDASLSADSIALVLRDNGIVDVEGYRKLGRNQLRVATFPNISTADVRSLTACIDYVIEAM